MFHVGIGVAKSKHDCFIINSDGVVRTDNLRITNDRAGFNKLLDPILDALGGEPVKSVNSCFSSIISDPGAEVTHGTPFQAHRPSRKNGIPFSRNRTKKTF